MSNQVITIGSSYNAIVADYDDVWSVHVTKPQQRLTRAMAISPGERVLDLGCGTGIDTVQMGKLAAPGAVWAVDPSEAMLETSSRRARGQGLTLHTHCQGASEFLAGYAGEPFDLVSLRFCLGYVDADTFLTRVPRLLRPGGRLGLVSILASSAPQAYQVYADMAEEQGVPVEPMSAVATLGDIEAPLRAAGMGIDDSWTYSFRLHFSTGAELARWLRRSGIATNATLAALPVALQDLLWDALGTRVERYRERDGIPLDFDIGGVVASVEPGVTKSARYPG